MGNDQCEVNGPHAASGEVVKSALHKFRNAQRELTTTANPKITKMKITVQKYNLLEPRFKKKNKI